MNKYKLDFQHIKGILFVLIGAIGFASKAIIVKLLYHYPIDTISILTLRMLFALPFFLAVIFYLENNKQKNITLKDRIWMPLMGFFGYYVSSFLDFMGLQFVSAGLERLILFIYPTIVILLSLLIFKKPIQKIQIYALILTYLGIALAMTTDFTAQGEYFLLGAFFIFCSAFTYSFYLLGSEQLIPRIGPILYSSWVMFYATIFTLIHYAFLGKADLSTFPPTVYALSFLMAGIATIIPIFLTAEGIRLIGAGNMAIVGNIGPISTIILGNIFLNEPILLWQLVGTSFVLVGIFLIGSKKNKNTNKSKELVKY